MSRLHLLLLGSLLLLHQTVQAEGENHVALSETFSSNTVTGGRDGNYGVGSGKPYYDIDGWNGTNADKVYGAHECVRFGTSEANGSCSTPEIILIGTGRTATLTFNAAGWTSGTNTLTVTANEGVTLTGDKEVTLVNGKWNSYTVNITSATSAAVRLTFTGRRGFLDDVKVEETVTAINAPTLPDAFLFWPNTTEANAKKNITLVPSDSTTVYYTTDDSEPSPENGTAATLTTTVTLTGTTTVKAKAYYKSVASNVVARTYTQGNTVNSISEFLDLSNDIEVRLFLADDESQDCEARVLYYDESRHQLFLRDKTGAICIDFGETATFNPTPQYNQHVAGWIIGKKGDENGLPKLVATGNTTTDYLAFAEPVTESQTEPNSIYNEDLANHRADWVTINEQRVGTDLAVVDRFGTTVYEGAQADLSGIVIPNGDAPQIALIQQNDIPAAVYVIDEQKAFISPSTDIENATVRLKRTLSSSNWNTFAVPFAIASMDASIREFDAIDGNMMMFKTASDIKAGMPYLVKPATDIVNPVFSDVTLSATAAKTISDGGYSFVAIYSPTELASDKTEQFLKTDGKLYYPAANTKLRGMRAFFRTPAGQAARLALYDDDMTGITTAIIPSHADADALYDLSGRRMNAMRSTIGSPLKKGIYIRQGKKIVVR